MRLDQVDGRLRKNAELLFGVGRGLTGREPEDKSGWYKLEHKDGSGFAWLRIIGEQARKYPPRSIHLALPAVPAMQRDERLHDAQNWWGKASRDLVVEEADLAGLATAVEVIARSFWLDETGG
jgi:hypothetical protein